MARRVTRASQSPTEQHQHFMQIFPQREASAYRTLCFLQMVFWTLPAPPHPVTLGGSSLGLLPSRSYRHGAVVMTSAEWGSVHLTSLSLSPQTSPFPPPPPTPPPPLRSHCLLPKTVNHLTQNFESCQLSKLLPVISSLCASSLPDRT